MITGSYSGFVFRVRFYGLFSWFVLFICFQSLFLGLFSLGLFLEFVSRPGFGFFQVPFEGSFPIFGSSVRFQGWLSGFVFQHMQPQETFLF